MQSAPETDRAWSPFGAQAGLVATSTSAAAVLALASVEPPRRILVQRAHHVSLDAPIADLASLAGASLVDVGAVDRTGIEEVAQGISSADAALYVFAEQTAPGAIDLPRFLWLARSRGVITIVVDETSGNWPAWIDAGADLVVLSAAAIDHPLSAGVLIGGREAIERARSSRQPVSAPFLADAQLTARIEAAAARWRAPESRRVEKVSMIPTAPVTGSLERLVEPRE